MDTFFHGFLTYLIFRKEKYKVEAVLFGIMPDLFPLPLFIQFIYLGHLNNIELFNSFLYNEGLPIYLFLHSLTPYLIISILAFVLSKRKYYWTPLAGGGIHILVDILTHSEGIVKTFYLFYPYQKISLTAKYFSDDNFLFVAGCWASLLAVYIIFLFSSSVTKQKKGVIRETPKKPK